MKLIPVYILRKRVPNKIFFESKLSSRVYQTLALARTIINAEKYFQFSNKKTHTSFDMIVYPVVFIVAKEKFTFIAILIAIQIRFVGESELKTVCLLIELVYSMMITQECN